MSNRHFLPAILIFVSFNFLACEVPVEKIEEASSGKTETEFQLKLNNEHNLFDTSLKDLQQYLVIKGNDKVFMKICHVPKGNPENFQSLTLPMEAIAAHLKHGIEEGEKDFLGECEPVVVEVSVDSNDENSNNDSGEAGDDSSNDSDDNSSTDDNSSSNDSSSEDGSDSADSDSDEELLPIWCEIDLDSECDGIIDESGDLYIVIQ